MKPIVFLGPSLPVAQARRILDAEYLPPVAQGDIMRSLTKYPEAIAIIDGVFKDHPTTRHREILWAMSRGIPVYGAASMGALRAAELSGFGMIGVGLIYRWYRRFALLPDDAVAVTHAPAALGSTPLSDALVDIQRSLRRAVRSGAMDRDTAQRQLSEMAAKPFPDRRLPAELAAHRVAQKAADARALLHRLAKHAASGDWPQIHAPRPAIVHAWLDDLSDAGLRGDDLGVE